ncbi:hypothetical protein J7J18_05710 [bacterium]|nr:hypothetical protein [bacterium]
MPLEVKKRPKETSQALVRRFNRILKQSGILFRARKLQFREREKSREMKKREALRREEIKKRYKKLEKLGKI